MHHNFYAGFPKKKYSDPGDTMPLIKNKPCMYPQCSYLFVPGSPYTVAVGFQGGDVLLMRGYDDCIPQVIVKENTEARFI